MAKLLASPGQHAQASIWGHNRGLWMKLERYRKGAGFDTDSFLTYSSRVFVYGGPRSLANDILSNVKSKVHEVGHKPFLLS